MEKAGTIKLKTKHILKINKSDCTNNNTKCITLNI